MKEICVNSCSCSATSYGKKVFVGKTIDGIFGFLNEACEMMETARQ